MCVWEIGVCTYIFVNQNHTSFNVNENIWSYILDLPVSWEVPLELFCNKTISGLDLKLYLTAVFPSWDRNRLFSYHTLLWVHELSEEVFILWTSVFPHSAAQLQLGNTWTELLVTSEMKIDIVYDFRLWLWAWDHHLRLFIPLHCITLTYLITGSLFKKAFEKNRRKSTIFSDKLKCLFNGPSSNVFVVLLFNHWLASASQTKCMDPNSWKTGTLVNLFPGSTAFWKSFHVMM